MMSFNMRTKSVALALAMVVSTCSNVSAFTNPVPGIIATLVNNKEALAVSGVMSLLIAMKVRLDTKPRCSCDYDNMQEDFVDLLNSYNVFDADSRATILSFVDKYLVGRKFKKEELTTRTKNDDGTVSSLKGSKVVQTPAGFMGLLDAYVLMQAGDLTKLVAATAGLYVLVNDPYGTFGREVVKATKP